MRLGRRLTKEMVWFGVVLLGAASCSVLYDLDQVQCEIPDDCAGFQREAGIKEVKCVEGICAYHYLSTSTSGGTGGTGGGSGGTSSTTSPSTGGSGGGTPSTSSSSTGSSAGAGGAPGCVVNDECMELGNPAICRDGECIDLFSDECPIVLGTGDNNSNLKSPREPLIFGAYAGMGATIPENTAITANYEFAIDQVNDKTGDGWLVANVRRPFVAVVCDVNGDIPTSMQHLVKTLNVPAIIPTFNSRTLLDVFENDTYGASKNNVFLMSPFDADSTLTNEDVDPKALMWHLLGEAADLGAAYKPLVERAEAFLRAQHELSSEEPIRVAMVVADTTYLKDIASVITSTVQFNGMSVTDNEDAENFLRVSVESIEVNPSPSLSDAYTTLKNMDPPPHLVLAVTSSEFMYDGLLRDLENYWHATMSSRPPFYLLSPRVSRNLTRARAQEFETPPFDGNPEFIPLRERLLSVAPAGAEITTLYDNYLTDFKDVYRHLTNAGVTLDGTENFYDAAYYTMYAIHGGKTITNITGLDVARGMARLLGGSLEYDIGDRNKISEAIGVLRNTDSFITLNGTLGPPDFNGSGAKTSLPSVSCIDLDPQGSNNEMAFYPDVLRYDPGTESLIGDDPCSVTGFMEDL